MDDNFAKNIIEDLEKSGFGSEMRAMQVFMSNGWRCYGGEYYIDKDEGKTREIDIVAHHALRKDHTDNDLTLSFFYVVAEVKKSEKPWVVFRRKPHYREGPKICAWNNLAKVKMQNKPAAKLADVLSNHSLRVVSDYLGYGIHESFKKPTDSSKWYQAFVNVSKAAEYQFELHAKYLDKKEQDNLSKIREFLFVQPIVIFDGMLLSAELDSTGDIGLEEIEEVPTEFHFKNNNYNRAHYCVDLVKLSHLEVYLDRCKLRQFDVVERIQELTKPE